MERRSFITKSALISGVISLGLVDRLLASNVKVADVFEVSSDDFKAFEGQQFIIEKSSGQKGQLVLKNIHEGPEINGFRRSFVLTFSEHSSLISEEGLYQFYHPSKGLIAMYLVPKTLLGGQKIIEAIWN